MRGPMALPCDYLTSFAWPMTLARRRVERLHPSLLRQMFVQRRRTVGRDGEILDHVVAHDHDVISFPPNQLVLASV